MWYVIQTITGKEQELVDAIENVMAGNKEEKTYKRCFVLYRECIWRVEGQLCVHIEPIFPSYVFAETDDPDAFFIALKQVPKLSKLLGTDGSFWSIDEAEEKFLRNIIDTTKEGMDCENRRRKKSIKTTPYLVRRSLVSVDSEGQVISAEGALKNYVGQIVKQRLRKRSVIIEISFLGGLRRIQLGIRLKEDVI